MILNNLIERLFSVISVNDFCLGILIEPCQKICLLDRKEAVQTEKLARSLQFMIIPSR